MRRTTANAIARTLARIVQAFGLAMLAFSLYVALPARQPVAGVFLFTVSGFVLLLSTLAVDNA